MPPPHELKGKPRNSQRSITFRLNDDADAVLRQLAEGAEIGPSTLARRIVEHYLREHAPSKTKKGG